MTSTCCQVSHLSNIPALSAPLPSLLSLVYWHSPGPPLVPGLSRS